MKIEEIRNEHLDEVYYDITHPSGLKILVMPKSGYSGTYAIFATKYGSIDTFDSSKRRLVQINPGGNGALS